MFLIKQAPARIGGETNSRVGYVLDAVKDHYIHKSRPIYCTFISHPMQTVMH